MYCVVEYTLGSMSAFTELPEKIPAVILKVPFKAFGGMTERYCAIEYLEVPYLFADRLRIPF